MKNYNLQEIEKCYVCGSVIKNISKFLSMVTSNLSNYEKEVHPKEKERQERLQAQQRSPLRNGGEGLRRRSLHGLGITKNSFASLKKYDNSLIVVSGNCGIGVKDLGYYHDIFSKLEEHLAKNNCYVFFIRGNGDDPSIFNECKIDYEHVKTIPDYSVILLKNYNCLCIGGSVSIDKAWKLSQEKEFGKKMYWENESPTYQKDTLKEIIKEYEIGCVISSSSPSFAFPGTNFYTPTKWFKKDKSLHKSFVQERKTLDKIYSTIIEKDSKPYVWVYGRFGYGNTAKINDIIFLSLGKYEISDVGEIIRTNFGIATKDKLEKNTHSLDDIIKDISASMCFEARQAPNYVGTFEGENIQEEDPPYIQTAQSIVENTITTTATNAIDSPNPYTYAIDSLNTDSVVWYPHNSASEAF